MSRGNHQLKFDCLMAWIDQTKKQSKYGKKKPETEEVSKYNKKPKR
jgi:hypothetical protein